MCRTLTHRFIPASAGNRVTMAPVSSVNPVHPRERGEQPVAPVVNTHDAGSSPRARGTVLRLKFSNTQLRFIPASAGNSRETISVFCGFTVHPRERGEQTSSHSHCCLDYGSSPRARGTVSAKSLYKLPSRFIPASAGNRMERSLAKQNDAVHPRERGEQVQNRWFRLVPHGSSPRARGTAPVGGAAANGSRFIPASAGNSQCPFR